MSAPSPSAPRDERWAAEDVPRGDAPASPASPASDSIHRLVVLGFITAAAMPPVGFVLGLLLATRLAGSSAKRGFWIILVSVVAAVVWVLLLTTGVLNPNSNDTSF